jgi:hypothetical protein
MVQPAAFATGPNQEEMAEIRRFSEPLFSSDKVFGTISDQTGVAR